MHCLPCLWPSSSLAPLGSFGLFQDPFPVTPEKGGISVGPNRPGLRLVVEA